MPGSRREFLQLAGSATGAALLTGCSAGQAAADGSGSAAGAENSSGASDPARAPKASPSGAPPESSGASAAMASLKSYLQPHASGTFSLPPGALSVPTLSWAGPLATFSAATTLPDGVIIPAANALISRPIPQFWTATLPGNPTLNGLPCLNVARPYTCSGVAKTVASPRILRFQTDAQVIELSGVVPDYGQTVQTLIVDGQLLPAKVLSSCRALGGWNAGTIRIAFDSAAVHDIWIETYMYVAYLKIGASDTLSAVNDASDPQITVVGDSYLQSGSGNFGNGGAIALEAAARLGIRKIATDAVGGTGFWNTGGEVGSLNDRLPGHSKDGSTIYLITAGLNDYGNLQSNGTVTWPSGSAFQGAVLSYLQGLRAANPNSLIVVTAPLCPDPPMSDSSYVANSGTNSSGMGDFLYMAGVHLESLQQIAAPWVYIDVLMGGGWLNSSGASGDIRNLQWFTGGTPGPGTTSTYKPGNTLGGGGGGFGGIATVPVTYGGQYSQAPDVTASGGSGSGLLLASQINSSGAVTSISVLQPGKGYSSGSGLPTITLDPTFRVSAAALGTPTLTSGINPNGAYPLPSWEPEGVTDLNNIYRMLMVDKTHPSPVGVEYLSRRLALNIFEAVMAL
jgi:hypothetical protein